MQKEKNAAPDICKNAKTGAAFMEKRQIDFMLEMEYNKAKKEGG